MPESQVDRLKKELRFLKESFEAGIISEAEYMKGKKRIETKLEDWGEGVVEEYGINSRKAYERKIVAKEIIVEEKDLPKEEIEEEIDDSQEEIRERVMAEDEKKQLRNEIIDLKQKIEEKDFELKEKTKENKGLNKKVEKYERELIKNEDKIQKLKERGKNKSHFDIWKYVSVILVLIIILLFFTKIKPDIKDPIDPTLNETIKEPQGFLAACYKDSDCEGEEGKIVICMNKATEEAICQVLDPIEVELMILNDKNCDSCDTIGTMQVINQLFPGVKIENIDYNTEEGKAFYLFYGVDYLPAYIFAKELNETYSWKTNERLRSSFDFMKNKYLLKSESTGSSYEPK